MDKRIKLSKNYKCLTLELTDDAHIAKLSKQEQSHIQTRRDKTRFLRFCSNCLQPGHASTRCLKRHKICVAGDSHTSLWTSCARFYVNTHVVRKRISGMSAHGLSNAHSKSQAAKRIVAALRSCCLRSARSTWTMCGTSEK